MVSHGVKDPGGCESAGMVRMRGTRARSCGLASGFVAEYAWRGHETSQNIQGKQDRGGHDRPLLSQPTWG